MLRRDIAKGLSAAAVTGALPHTARAAESVLRVGMTAADIPTTTGQPSQGSEGVRFAGHTGYEFHAKWLMDSWLGKFLNTPTNHIQHHDSFKGNFGLYFNYWDRWMGTNHPDYEKRFREVTSR
jgi:hypothetical protein